MIKVAVIGSGYWGTKLIGEYLNFAKKTDELQLGAIADVSRERLLQIKGIYSLSDVKLETEYTKVLNDPTITGVHIAVSNEQHFEIASKAIALGKHVLLEKPMALNSVDAFKLVRQAEKNGSTLLIGHIFRFNNAVNKIKELIENKEISDPRYIELKWSSLLFPLPDRDVIFDLAPHPIDILNHIFEEWPTQVFAKGFSYDRQKVGREEIAFVTLSFPNDVLCSVCVSWIDHGPRERAMVLTNKSSSIKLDVVNQTIRVYEKGISKEMPIERNNTIEAEITHFFNAIRNNDPPINSGLTGAMNVTILQAVRQSLAENKAIPIFRG
jgi:UDP-N-acetylglucosamine 3-dehydrogenase